MADHDEIELKLEISPADAANIDTAALLQGDPPQKLRLRSTYFDLPGERLRAAGLSLRIREEGGLRTQTVKVASSAGAGLFARREWEKIVEQDRPVIDDSLPLRTMLGPFDSAELIPLFEIRVDRTVHHVRSGDSTVEIAIDQGEAQAGGRQECFCEIELELLSGTPAALFDLVRRIDTANAGRIGVLSKAERGYRLLSGHAGAAVKAEAVTLDAAMPSATAFRAIAQACLRQFRLNEAALRDAEHEDMLHQARVALRRLRSTIWIFREMLDDGDRDRIYGELRWLAGECGDARAIDVLIRMTDDATAKQALQRARGDAYARARSALDSSRARSAILDLVEWLAVGPWSIDTDKAELRAQPVAILAATALDRLRRRIKRAGNLEKLDDAEWHRVRIAAKKLRYACDYFAQLFPGKKARKRADLFVKALEKLQDRLGALNDIVTAPAIMVRLGQNDTADRMEADKAGKAALIARAEKARSRLVDLKRFWR